MYLIVVESLYLFLYVHVRNSQVVGVFIYVILNKKLNN